MTLLRSGNELYSANATLGLRKSQAEILVGFSQPKDCPKRYNRMMEGKVPEGNRP
jgi:hypothetical protein